MANLSDDLPGLANQSVWLACQSDQPASVTKLTELGPAKPCNVVTLPMWLANQIANLPV